MFFDDEKIVTKKQARLKYVETPETGWRPPASFPNLSSAVAIGFDVETKETDFTHGPGWSRSKGHIVGFSLSAVDAAGNRGKWYFPVRHEVEPEYNLDPKQCFAWLKTVLETPHIPKVGANLLYDIGWLTEENIYVLGELLDVQFAEALIDEQGEVSLEYLGSKYLGRGKKTDILYAWLAEAYGGAASQAQRQNIYRASPRLAGPYAEDDADLPLDILEKQWAILGYENLVDLFRMECGLIPLLIRMRLAGVTVDVKAAEQLYVELRQDTDKLYEQLIDNTGVAIESVNSATELAKIFDSLGLEYPRTDAGAPSFRKEFLKSVEHPVADLINDIREHEKIRGTFVKSYLLESNVNGLIHCQFHPLRSDEGGTKTGRFSSSDPNLQNIPVRTALGKKVRKAFIPDAGHYCVRKYDYSQIEYRMLANFAVGPGSEDLRATYNNDPTTDYHEVVQTNVHKITNLLIDRKPIKNINFGLLYGQSEPALAYKAGFTSEQAKGVFKAYHSGAPYVKPTMKAIGQEVQRNGYVCTILGRRTRFNLWEPIKERGIALPHDQAVRRYGSNIRRAYEYRGVNYKLQGSAADVIKKAMYTAFKSGIFDFIGVPKLQVHDELVFSQIDNSDAQNKAYDELQHILETALLCRVPIKAEGGVGPNWGTIE